MRVRITRQAREDLIDIWDYLADSHIQTANDCIDRITARCHQLADFPELGPDRSTIFKGARLLVIERWLIFYRITRDEVQIVRIVDASRNLRSLSFPEE